MRLAPRLRLLHAESLNPYDLELRELAFDWDGKSRDRAKPGIPKWANARAIEGTEYSPDFRDRIDTLEDVMLVKAIREHIRSYNQPYFVAGRLPGYLETISLRSRPA